MQENFLNSTSFEQMAREYNKKYGFDKTAIMGLQNDNNLLNFFKEVFDDAYDILLFFEKGFAKFPNFKSFLETVATSKKEFLQTYKNIFDFEYIEKEGTLPTINNRALASKVLKLFEDFVQAQSQSINFDCSQQDFKQAFNKMSSLQDTFANIVSQTLSLLKQFYTKV